jgi:DNA polymerase
MPRLASPTDIAGFRSEAQTLLARQVPPEEVQWEAPEHESGEVSAPAPLEEGRRRGLPRAASAIVPASFVRLCDFVVQHRDPERFALLYRLLWRLVHEPGLRHESADTDLLRAQHMAHAVRRDIHKLKSNLRWRAAEDPAHPGDPLHVAWCEPAHHVVEAVGPWLAQRYAGMRWALLTPERSVYWNRQSLLYGPGLQRPPPSGASDAQWLACWQALFHPVRAPH